MILLVALLVAVLVAVLAALSVAVFVAVLAGGAWKDRQLPVASWHLCLGVGILPCTGNPVLESHACTLATYAMAMRMCLHCMLACMWSTFCQVSCRWDIASWVLLLAHGSLDFACQAKFWDCLSFFPPLDFLIPSQPTRYSI